MNIKNDLIQFFQKGSSPFNDPCPIIDQLQIPDVQCFHEFCRIFPVFLHLFEQFMPLSQDFGIIDQITHVDRIDLTEFLVDKISTDRWSPFDQIQIFRRENDDIDIAV